MIHPTPPSSSAKRNRSRQLDVAIIIVSWNVRHYLADCLRSVMAELRYSKLRGKVWLVDNASTDGTIEFVETLFPNVNVIPNDENSGFGAGNNQGMRAAAEQEPRHYLLLNPDTLVRTGAIGKMVRHLDENPDVGMVGSRLVYGDGRLQHSAFAFPGLRQLLFEFWPLPARLYNTWVNGRYPARKFTLGYRPFEVDFALGAAMMVRREVAEETGGFDEAFHMYCEEIDWAWRIRNAGYSIYTVPSAEIVHYGGESTKQIPAASVVNLWKSRAQLYSKYYAPWKVQIAKHIVQSGLLRRSVLAETEALKDAYQEAADAWA